MPSFKLHKVNLILKTACLVSKMKWHLLSSLMSHFLKNHWDFENSILNIQNYFVKQASTHLIYSPWLLSFLLCVCLPVFACPSLSLLTAPLNQLMRCLRKYQSRTPSPLLHSVPSEIVFDFEPGPVFRGSWALLSCFHPKQTKYINYSYCLCLTFTACVCKCESFQY